jgi:hypothetical protein
MGVVFALQGANVIGGSQLMSGNSAYIYVGSGVVIVGILLAALGVKLSPKGGKQQSAAN